MDEGRRDDAARRPDLVVGDVIVGPSELRAGSLPERLGIGEAADGAARAPHDEERVVACRERIGGRFLPGSRDDGRARGRSFDRRIDDRRARGGRRGRYMARLDRQSVVAEELVRLKGAVPIGIAVAIGRIGEMELVDRVAGEESPIEVLGFGGGET
jgi:hypothetical protein